MGKRPMVRRTYGKKAMKLPPLAAFDFETEGLGGKFIIGAIVTDTGERILLYTLADVFEYMRVHSQYRYLAHNASGYEFAYLYPYLYDFFQNTEQCTIIPTLQGDSTIVQIRIEWITEDEKGKKIKQCIDMRDTLCLFSMSLEQVAKAFCPELPKLTGNINFEKETFDIHNQEHIDYVFRDCDIVLLAYQRHAQNMAETFGSPLGVTAGSTALKAFYTTIDEDKKYWRTNKDAEHFIRKCYYGGLVLPGHQLGNWGEVGSVDVNGAYAYQMGAHSYPVGNPARTCHYHGPDLPGFYQVIATVPSTVFEQYGFNPVPRRDKEGLVWATGTFETYVTGIEIDYALSLGCHFDILDGYVFYQSDFVFGNFVQKCQEMELAEGGKYKPTIKLNRNACYGKFGSKEEHTALLFSKETIVDPSIIPYTPEGSLEMIDGLYIKKESTDAEYMLPHWAAMITAYERLYIMKFIQKAYELGAKNVYADTDSIKCDLPIIIQMIKDGIFPMGNYYGQFKMEETCQRFILLGPKCFYGDVVGKDEPLMKAKGVPKRALQQKDYLLALEAFKRPVLKGKRQVAQEKHREIEFDSLYPLLTIIKTSGTMKPMKRKRKITDLRNSYSWQIADDLRIYPHGYQKENTNYPG